MITKVSLDLHRRGIEAKVRGDRRHKIRQNETKEAKGRNDNTNTKKITKDIYLVTEEGEQVCKGNEIVFKKTNLLSCVSRKKSGTITELIER